MFKNKIVFGLENFKLDLIGDKKVVFTNGCFDIIHPGHLNYLYRASREGEILVVGINSDKSVKANKGDSRPINNIHQRAEVLSYLNFIDYIIVFDEKTPLKLIEAIEPDILVKGGDYLIDQIVGSEYVLNIGGEVKTLDFIDGYSSSEIIKKLC